MHVYNIYIYICIVIIIIIIIIIYYYYGYMCLFVLGYPKICWQMITFHISRNFRIARGTTFQSAELHDATQASETLQQKCSQHLFGVTGQCYLF